MISNLYDFKSLLLKSYKISCSKNNVYYSTSVQESKPLLFLTVKSSSEKGQVRNDQSGNVFPECRQEIIFHHNKETIFML